LNVIKNFEEVVSSSYTFWYSPDYWSGSPTISTLLNAGSYFLLVNSNRWGSGAAYNLTLAEVGTDIAGHEDGKPHQFHL
jgi:hypothetical protein